MFLPENHPPPVWETTSQSPRFTPIHIFRLPKPIKARQLGRLVGIILTVVGLLSVFLLARSNNDIRQQAASSYSERTVCLKANSCIADKHCSIPGQPPERIPGKCGVSASTPTPAPTVPICRSGDSLLMSRVANSSECTLNEFKYFECRPGYVIYNDACVLNSWNSFPSCQSGTGLFSSAVVNSNICSYNNAIYFECRPSFHNIGGMCVLEHFNACRSEVGLLATIVANSTECVSLERKSIYSECNPGYFNRNGTCTPNTPPLTPPPVLSSSPRLINSARECSASSGELCVRSTFSCVKIVQKNCDRFGSNYKCCVAR